MAEPQKRHALPNRQQNPIIYFKLSYDTKNAISFWAPRTSELFDCNINSSAKYK